MGNSNLKIYFLQIKMKTYAILALISSVIAHEVAWTTCTSNADCHDYTCCNVTKDGQSPIKLCGNSGLVPIGSPAVAYDDGTAVCPAKVSNTSAEGAFSLSLKATSLIAIAYLMN